MDKRNQTSKEAIKKALIKLSKEKKYTEISIRELCREADISRSTFYNNYPLFNDVIAEMSEDFMNKIRGRKLDRNFFDTVVENSDQLKLLLDSGMFGKDFCMYLKDMITEEIKEENKKEYSDISLNVLTLYHAYGIFGVLLNIISKKDMLDAEIIKKSYDECINRLMEIIEKISAS